MDDYFTSGAGNVVLQSGMTLRGAKLRALIAAARHRLSPRFAIFGPSAPSVALRPPIRGFALFVKTMTLFSWKKACISYRKNYLQ
jgi:hypothetical protein